MALLLAPTTASLTTPLESAPGASVIVILDGFKVITLEDSQCNNAFANKHQLLVMNQYGYPILFKQFEGNTLELNSSEIGVDKMILVLSSGSCSITKII